MYALLERLHGSGSGSVYRCVAVSLYRFLVVAVIRLCTGVIIAITLVVIMAVKLKYLYYSTMETEKSLFTENTIVNHCLTGCIKTKPLKFDIYTRFSINLTALNASNK